MNLASPMISFVMPFMLLIIPFVILKFQKIPITFAVYLDVLKEIGKNHFIGKALATGMGSLTADGQIAALTGAQIYALKDAGINGLSTDQMALFTATQVEPEAGNPSTGFKAAQLTGMTVEQLGAFVGDAKTAILANAAQIAGLSVEQKTALGWTAPT